MMTVLEVIVRRGDRWFVLSEDRKRNLGKTEGYGSRGEAVKRLRQVEAFKRMRG